MNNFTLISIYVYFHDTALHCLYRIWLNLPKRFNVLLWIWSSQHADAKQGIYSLTLMKINVPTCLCEDLFINIHVSAQKCKHGLLENTGRYLKQKKKKQVWYKFSTLNQNKVTLLSGVCNGTETSSLGPYSRKRVPNQLEGGETISLEARWFREWMLTHHNMECEFQSPYIMH